MAAKKKAGVPADSASKPGMPTEAADRKRADDSAELAKRLAHAVRWGSAEDRAAIMADIDAACGTIPAPGPAGAGEG